MTQINYGKPKRWVNYHKTLSVDIAQPGAYLGAGIGAVSGPERFRATRDALFSLVARAAKQGVPVGVTGTAWSFAPLIGWENIQVDLTGPVPGALGLSGCSPADAQDLHKDSKFPAGQIALVSGGTTLRQLVNWGLPRKLSITTSGTHLGPTVAGAIAAASHGSRLGFGGIQDQIVGMHLITGPDSSVWIERAREPVLADAAASRFASSIIRSDAMFDDALVHLGGMGIINGVAFRMQPYARYHVLRVDQPVDQQWLADLAKGDFAAIAKRLGHDGQPIFYEATINPGNLFGPQALHTMAFVAPSPAPADFTAAMAPPLSRPSDFIAMLDPDRAGGGAAMGPGFDNLLAEYAKQAFKPAPPPIDARPGQGWEELHPTDIETGGHPGGLYNASYVVERSKIAEVLPLMCNAVKNIRPTSFVFTLRFVSNPSGTLAFTRFDENVVIELDGISRKAPDPFGQLGALTEAAAAALRPALDAGADYSMHWAKLGGLDAAKIAKDFGPAGSPKSPIGRWRATRDHLLGGNASLFVNQALKDYGLV